MVPETVPVLIWAEAVAAARHGRPSTTHTIRAGVGTEDARSPGPANHPLATTMVVSLNPQRSTMEGQKKLVKAHCNECRQSTNHRILQSRVTSGSDDEYGYWWQTK